MSIYHSVHASESFIHISPPIFPLNWLPRVQIPTMYINHVFFFLSWFLFWDVHYDWPSQQHAIADNVNSAKSSQSSGGQNIPNLIWETQNRNIQDFVLYKHQDNLETTRCYPQLLQLFEYLVSGALQTANNSDSCISPTIILDPHVFKLTIADVNV